MQQDCTFFDYIGEIGNVHSRTVLVQVAYRGTQDPIGVLNRLLVLC